MEFDPDTFKAQLDRYVTEHACAYCHGTEWEISPARLALHTISADGTIDIAKGPVLVAVPLVCRHCGFVRLHAPDLLPVPDGEL